MQSRRRRSYSRQVTVSHFSVPSRLQVASQSYSHIFHQSVTFLYVTDSGDYFHQWLNEHTYTHTACHEHTLVSVTSHVSTQLVTNHEDSSTVQPRPRPVLLVLCSYVSENRFDDGARFLMGAWNSHAGTVYKDNIYTVSNTTLKTALKFGI